ncbi:MULTISPECIES: response regulator transcription factor [Brevibacterium]|nr:MULTISPECIES: response regulator transcription factor [Brevibacterium]
MSAPQPYSSASSDSATAISILVVDDQELTRMGNALMLEADDDLKVVGEAASGEEAVRRVRELRPHVVLMDVRMPGIGGIEATRIITAAHPNTKIIVFTTFDVDEYAFDGLQAGASAFLLKSSAPEQVRAAVRTANAGEAVVEPRITKYLVDHFTSRTPAPPRARAANDQPSSSNPLDQLSPREREVFHSMAAGLSNSEICEAFHLSPATVKTHVNRVFAKLHLRDRVHAVILAYRLRTPRS